MTMALSASNVWPLEKYARFLPDKAALMLPTVKDTAKKGGTWKHYSSSKDCGIQLALVQSNHFLISSGNQIYESFSLWQAHRWIKGVNKGDSILFIYQLKDENRRFRIKFSSQSPHKTSLETCTDCIEKLSSILPIREMGAVSSSSISTAQRSSKPSSYEVSSLVVNSRTSQECEESQMFSQEPNQMKTLSQENGTAMELSTNLTLCDENPSVANAIAEDNCRTGLPEKQVELNIEAPMESELMSLPTLAEMIGSKGKSLGRAYAETNFPTNQLSEFVRLCLTDSNFPSFVEAVEREMINITK